jgi:beta-glucosidase
VAWLPGSEGAGVADVLFTDAEGKTQYDFQGRLSFDWPANNLNRHDHEQPVDEFLFEFGYGLDYKSSPQTFTKLEESLIVFDESIDITIFDKDTKSPWSLYVGDKSNWATKVSGNFTNSETKSISISSKDFRVQEDARQITWHGTQAQVYWQTKAPINLSQLRDAGGALSFMLKLDEKLNGHANLRMDCGWPCSDSINISPLLQASPLNQWQNLAIPLKCFSDEKLKLEMVDTPFVIEAKGSLQISIAEIAIIESPKATNMINCENSIAMMN